MKTIYLIILALWVSYLKAQDTFSIVAADSATREVGSAGASCVDLFAAGFSDASFLGDLLPDTGAINTQASYLPGNQNNARARMRAGDTPSQMITWLSTSANDVQGNASSRQYGIVGFSGTNLSSAGYTGTGCLDYKSHITGNIDGIYYSIQGNILLGQMVLDSMESKFRNAQGDLACRLMAALQGAKMVGADTRCAPNNSSSLFAFVKVAQPNDAYGSPSFILTVRTHNNDQIEPIDSLQTLFTAQNNCGLLGLPETNIVHQVKIYPNPAGNEIMIKSDASLLGTAYTITDKFGRLILTGEIMSKTQTIDIRRLATGVYFIQAKNGEGLRFVKE